VGNLLIGDYRLLVDVVGEPAEPRAETTPICGTIELLL